MISPAYAHIQNSNNIYDFKWNNKAAEAQAAPAAAAATTTAVGVAVAQKESKRKNETKWNGME